MPRGNDSRDHPGRRPVDPRITHSQDTDEAPAHGIPRPKSDDFTSGPVVDGPNDTELGSSDPEDLREQTELQDERYKRGYW